MDNRNMNGIDIEIDGKTTKLERALKRVNRDIQDTENQLTDVSRLLKLDPSNIELLSQKQRILTDSIQETKEKMNTLNAAAEQAYEKLSMGKMDQSRYDELRRECVNTEQQLKNLENQMTKTDYALSSTGQAGAKMQEVGRKAEGVGRAMLPVTNAIRSMGEVSVQAMNTVDEGLDVIVKKTGATGDAMDGMQTVFNNVAGTIPADFEDIGTAIGEANMRLGFTGGELESASTQFLKFARINDVDVGPSIQLIAKAMGDAGIEAAEYNQVLDALTIAGQQSGVSVDTLAASLAEYGAPMRDLGFDTQSAIALFAGWEEAGISTETAFSGMKEAMAGWTQEGKDASTEFSNVMGQIRDAPTIADATSIAVEAFGRKMGPDFANAIQGGRIGLEDYMRTVQNAEGTVDNTYAGIVNDVESVQVAGQNFQVALHDIGESIMVTLGPVLLTLSEKIREVGEWFSGLSDGQKQTIITILGIVAAVAPLLIAMGQIAGGIGSIMQVIGMIGPVVGGITTAVQGIGAVIAALASPVTIVIAIVAALVAAFIYFWNTSEGFREFFISLGEGIVSFISGIFSAIGDLFASIINFFTVTLPGAFQQAISFLSEISVWWGEFWSGIFNLAIEFLSNLISAVSEKVIGVKDAIVNGIQMAVEYITALPAQALQWGKDIIAGIASGIKNAIGEVTGAVSDIAGRIRAYLHFSVPDEGPLTDYESWMPDFISGLAKGIHNSKGMLENAVGDLAGSMMIAPQYAPAAAAVTGSVSSARTQQSSNDIPGTGNTIIPVYIGQKLLDEIVIDAQTRNNFRSGGR